MYETSSAFKGTSVIYKRVSYVVFYYACTVFAEVSQDTHEYCCELLLYNLLCLRQLFKACRFIKQGILHATACFNRRFYSVVIKILTLSNIDCLQFLKCQFNITLRKK